jgi:hypothetical protein
MKYLTGLHDGWRGPHDGWRGPQISPCIYYRKRAEYLLDFAYDDILINFASKQVWHN